MSTDLQTVTNLLSEVHRDVCFKKSCFDPCHKGQKGHIAAGKFCLHIRSKTTVVQPWDRAKRGGGMSTAGHAQNLAGQGTDQADFVLKAVEFGKRDEKKDLQMCLHT